MPDYIPPLEHAHIGRRFLQDGFVLLNGAFTVLQIAELRAAAIQLFGASKPNEPQFSSTALFEEPFRSIIFRNVKLIKALRDLLGTDFVFLSELALHDSFFAGWHTDTSSPEGKAGHDFHWSPSFMVVNAAIYLMDNQDNGGGLDVVPRSYLRDDPAAIALRRETGFPEAHLREPDGDPYSQAVTLRTRAGDATIFHLRTSHRSSIGSKVDRKLAIFMVAGPNNASTFRYRAWLDEYAKMNGTTRSEIPSYFLSFLAELELSII